MPREIPEAAGRTIARLEVPDPDDPDDAPVLRIVFADGGELTPEVGFGFNDSAADGT
jgi:hypothetical protein